MELDEQPYYITLKEEVKAKDSAHRALPKESTLNLSEQDFVRLLVRILPLSSVGTSMRLLTAVSWVRAPEGQPYVHLAQLDRVPPYEGVGWEFESLNGRQHHSFQMQIGAYCCSSTSVV